ncbi:MAG: hypothetical protein ACODAE_10800, partial [Gemmatimonadota bacterium]
MQLAGADPGEVDDDIERPADGAPQVRRLGLRRHAGPGQVDPGVREGGDAVDGGHPGRAEQRRIVRVAIESERDRVGRAGDRGAACVLDGDLPRAAITRSGGMAAAGERGERKVEGYDEPATDRRRTTRCPIPDFDATEMGVRGG